jgi:hypothetical protein
VAPRGPAAAGSQNVLDLQRAYYQGEIPREAALASASLVFGFTPAEAEKLFPLVLPVQPVRSPWVIVTVVLGALAGAIAGGLLAQQLTSVGSVVEHRWSEFALFLGLVGGALLGALIGPLLRIGMIKVWQQHAEAS